MQLTDDGKGRRRQLTVGRRSRWKSPVCRTWRPRGTPTLRRRRATPCPPEAAVPACCHRAKPPRPTGVPYAWERRWSRWPRRLPLPTSPALTCCCHPFRRKSRANTPKNRHPMPENPEQEEEEIGWVWSSCWWRLCCVCWPGNSGPAAALYCIAVFLSS